MLVCALLAVVSRASAQDAREIAIWYRSANGCPDGDAFVRSLAARSVRGRLAQVGDAIDFVVTLGEDAAGSRGVLERQTETGTVAIRRVDDASCEQVAEALSLTLALAASSPEPGASPPRAMAAAPQPAPSPTPTSIIKVSAPVQPRAERHDAPSGTLWSFGAHGLIAGGIAPGLLAGAGVSIELELGAGVLRPAFRAAGFGAYGSGSRGGEDLSVQLLGGRFEVCPIELTSEPVAFRPCVALDLGELHSERDGVTGRSDRGLWAASEGSVRLSWSIAPSFSLETQAGLLIPWTRYALESDDDPPDVLHRVSAVGGSARIGGVVHFP
jgi:hypothetical protein